MNRIIAALAAGALAALLAGCSTSAEQATGSTVIGSLAGAGIAAAPVGQAESAVTAEPASAPDYGAKKPHDHCGNGTMVHLGSVICSP
ncbi:MULTISPECIES: hypothetical protein [unclassified Rhizobium]|uniref:hypothetical protein n=1 Tax=unclassified Rhizobium TaxID=2613769 RepID=UPI0012E3CAB3|nr:MULTISPECIES: hypothetical protein [unclassified Rhizobium]